VSGFWNEENRRRDTFRDSGHRHTGDAFLIGWNEGMSAVRAMEEGTAIVAVAMLWALLKSAGLHLWRRGKT
jgi:hypothetical protein